MTAKKAPVPVPLYPHPLFLAEDDDDDAPRVELIKVTRWDRGQQLWVPQQFAPTELVTLEQVATTWGGGNYELIAYGHRPSDGKAGCVGRRRFSLPGAPRALDGSGEPPPAPPPAAPPAPAASGGSSDSWIPLLIAMMKTSSDSQAAMFQGTMQLVGGMIAGSRDAATAQVAQMQALSSAHAAQQAALLTAIVESKGGGGSGGASSALVEMLKEGIELGRASGGESGEGDEFGSLMETAAPIIAGMMQANQPSAPAPAPQPSASPPVPPMQMRAPEPGEDLSDE